MRLVDTSAWIEWLVGSSLGKSLAGELPTRAQWLVPTIVQHELAKWLMRNLDEDKANQVIAFSQICIVVELNTEIALPAADLCMKHKLATADAIVYATAARMMRTSRHAAGTFTCRPEFVFAEVVRVSVIITLRTSYISAGAE
jgi:predicted nucleic acid-binding protein